MSTATVAPRIYVASLASYNAGRGYGAWFDVDGDADELGERIAVFMEADPEHGEEYAIHDFEGFDGVRLGECPDLERVCAIASGLEEYGEAFAAYLSDVCDDVDLATRTCEDGFAEYKDEEDYGYSLGEDIYSAKELGTLANYIDWEAFGRDALMDVTYARVGSRIIVYNS